MIPKLSLRHMLHAKGGNARRHKAARLVYPAREWFVALLTLIVLFVVSAIYAGNLFLGEFNRDVFVGGSGGITAEAYKHKVVERVLSTYREREVSFEALLEGREVGVVTPPTFSETVPVSEEPVAEEESVQVE